MRRRAMSTSILGLVTAGAVALSGLVAAGAPAQAGALQAASRLDTSDVALKAGAYGTRLAGGDLPAGSQMTAFSVIGCSTGAGITHHNEVAAVDVPNLGTISGVATRVWTRKRHGALHSYARSSTAEIVLADSSLGTLSIRGITSLSHAWYDASGYHAKTSSDIGKIVLTPPVGDPQVIPIPTPGNPVTVPGLAELRVGASNEVANHRRSSAWAVALRIKVLATGSDLFVARSKAQALSGVKNGRFGGYSAGTQAKILGGVLTSGRNPVSFMPCQGTNGKVQAKSNADVNLGGGLHAQAVSSAQKAKRFDHRSRAWERGKVAGLNLGGGQLVIDAIVGKATVVRRANGKLKRSAGGTRIGSITANGQPQELPLDQTLEIPGVAKLQPKLVHKIAGGLKVVALRITLLDGTGAVIDLGVAKTTIRR